jgi:ribonuclease E
MTTNKKKPVKKSAAKKAPAKKAPAKKAAPKKAAADVKKDITPETKIISSTGPATPVAEKPTGAIVYANDVKNVSLRKRVLAWFRK